jgi:Ubiquitin-2 like Rad60 SUMO-like
MAAYCNKSSIDVESVAFIFDGQRIRGDQTPGDLDMEDQDEIEVHCCRFATGVLCDWRSMLLAYACALLSHRCAIDTVQGSSADVMVCFAWHRS